MKNRLALLFFAVLFVVPMAQAQRRRPSAPPPPQQPETGCALKTLSIGTYSADEEVDDQYVYFTDSANGIFRVLKSGGDAQQLALLPDNFINVLAIDDTTVYALTIGDDLTLGSCWSVPKTGGTPKELASNILTPYEIAVDANYVYWVSVGTPTGDAFLADGKLERIRKDGTGRTTLAANLNVPVVVASDGTTVFFGEAGLSPASSSSGLRTIPANGGSVKALTSGTGVVGLTLSGANVYFANLNFVTGGELLRIAKSGGSTTSLVKGLDVATRLAVVADRLYYFNSDDASTIEYVPLTGGARNRVVGGAFTTEEFAIDDCAVFYADGDGSLIRTPR